MTIFNLRVCQNHGSIYIKSVQLSVSHDDKWRSESNAISLSLKQRPIWDNSTEDQAHTIIQVMKDKFRYADPEKAQRAVDREEEPRYGYGVKTGDGIHLMEAIPTSYMLPFNPTLALDLLAAYTRFAAEREFYHIQLVNEDLGNKISNDQPHPRRKVNAGQLLNLGKEAVNVEAMLKMLMEAIVKLDAVDAQYKATITAIKKILQYSSSHPATPLRHCLEGKLRASILLDVPVGAVTFTAQPTASERMREIYSIARRLIADGLGSELDRLIEVLNEEAKMNIYQFCIGRRSFDNLTTFDWNDLYWEIFRTAAFTVGTDGRISIDLTTNACYCAISKQADFNAATFTTEFANLFKILQLSLDQDSNLSGRVIFSIETSQQLMAAGLHYNSNYIAKLIRERNTASLFNQARKHSANKEGKPCHLHSVPRDVVNIILGHAYDQIQQGLLPAEKNTMKALGQQQDPMAGLNMSFFKPATVAAEIDKDEHKNKCVIC